MWSERNLSKTFHPLSTRWFLDNEGLLATEVIDSDKEAYHKLRNELFEEVGKPF